VLNATNGLGASAKDIIGVRVLACDIDSPTTLKSLLSYRFAPHLIVESSPSRYHCYWAIPPQEQSSFVYDNFKKWRDYQLCLSCDLKGDPSLAVITHQLRFPSIYRADKDFTPAIVHVNDTDTLPIFTDEEIRLAREYQKKHRSKQKRQLKKGTLREGRHNTIYFSVLSGELSASEARAFNDSLENPLKEHEVEHAIKMAEKLRAQKLSESFLPIEEQLPKAPFFETLFGYSGISKTNTKGAGVFSTLNGNAIVYQDYKTQITSLIGDIEPMVAERFESCFVSIAGAALVYHPKDITWYSIEDRSAIRAVIFMIEACMIDWVNHPRFNMPSDISKILKVLRNQSSIFEMANRILKKITYKPISPTVINNALVGVKNGTFNLETGEHRDSLEEDYILHRVAINYTKTTKLAHGIRKFLIDMFQYSYDASTDSILDLLFEMFALSLSRRQGEYFFFHVGVGGNGKTTLLAILQDLFGDTFSLMPARFFSDRTISEEYFFSGKAGKRLIHFAEVDDKKFDTQKLKFFSERVVSARSQYEAKHQILNEATIHFTANRFPTYDEADLALARRLVILPYNKCYSQNLYERFPPHLRGEPKELKDLIQIFRAEESEFLYECHLAYKRLLKNDFKLSLQEKLVEEANNLIDEQNEIVSYLRESLILITQSEEEEEHGMQLSDIQELLMARFPMDNRLKRNNFVGAQLRCAFPNIIMKRVNNKRFWNVIRKGYE
jgi:uncharacterized coiled-coil protein SlyX